MAHVVIQAASDVTICKAGDVVKTREAMLDPLSADGVAIDAKHALATLG